jgi:outer membrane protein insertion porin family
VEKLLIRSVRELAQLGHFDPEKIVPTPLPDQAEGTVDLEYSLEERANDQVEISGGWGQNMVIGTVALTFNNFSTKNFFNKEAWRPLPTGDGQTLSLRAQATGPRYQLYSLTFVEPWLGGKKPNYLSVSLYHSMRSNYYDKGDTRRGTMKINGISIGMGRRITWPDDFFQLYHEISLQNYELNNWPENYFLFTDGKSNNLSLNTVLSRNSLDNPLYTRSGSSFSLGLQITPPFSLFKDHTSEEYEEMTFEQKYKWIEYHKWTFKADWYTRLIDDLVLRTRAQFGYLGYFDESLPSPFEGYYVGGDGMSGYNLYGSETIGLRGYKNNSFNRRNYLNPGAAMNLYNKYTLELRYPVKRIVFIST